MATYIDHEYDAAMKKKDLSLGLQISILFLIVMTVLGCGDSTPPSVSESEDVVFVYRRDINQPTTSLNAPDKVEHSLAGERAKAFIALINSTPTNSGDQAKTFYSAIWHRNYFEVAGRKYVLSSSSVFYQDENKNTWSWSHPLLKTMADLKDPDTIEATLQKMSSHSWPGE